MKLSKIILIAINLIVFDVGITSLHYKHKDPPVIEQIVEEPAPVEVPPTSSHITISKPSYMDYEQTIEQLKVWNSEAPDLTELKFYGKSSQDRNLVCLRIGNFDTKPKPAVLITACIHGNEVLASSTEMWYIGALLSGYGHDEEITKLVDSRDIYFVPIVSPDSYPNTRYVDNVDPNRNFDSLNPVAPVAGIQRLFKEINPRAVISMHTWGRVFLMPPASRMTNIPDHDKYVALLKPMTEMSGYRMMRTCDMYMSDGSTNNPPMTRSFSSPREQYYKCVAIYGLEVDWYYNQGATVIVMEIGTHQSIPANQEIQIEFDKTFKAVLHFIRKATD